jgi:hypothetical protein
LGTEPGDPLPYVAAIFKGSLTAWPQATLKITGNGMIGGMAQDRLERPLGVARDRIQIAQVYDRQYQDSVNISIVYFPPAAGTRSVWVAFQLDLEQLPISVEFEVSPDGAYVTEVKAEFDKLKATIKKYASRGVQNIKIGTSVSTSLQLDREVSTKVEQAIQTKVKALLSADLRLPGMARAITVQLYGSFFTKFDDKTKSGLEGGLILTVPYDFL